MSRTVAEIEAEIATAKGEGVHHSTARMVALRRELKDAQGGPITVEVTPAATVQVPDVAFFDSIPPDPYTSDEWRFIEKTVAETEMDFKSGSLVGVMKKLYNLLDAKLKLWRMAREIVAEIGVGKDWPQWAALGRDESTGRKQTAKPKPVLLSAAPAPVASAPVAPAGPPSELDAMAASIAARMGAALSDRAEPPRAAPAEAVG